jgi:hypothetical protein
MKMITTKRMMALAGVLALGLTAAKAQEDGALLSALVKKGVLSDQEAQDIRASEEKDLSTTAADKIAVSDYVQKLTFYGDVRYRWEYADEKALATGAGGTVSQANGNGQGENIIERSRIRVRLGVDAKFTDNFTGGVEVETSENNDSANQTLGNAYGKGSINLGLAYLSYKPTDWLTLTGGKMRNPLYTTDLTWDPDINPEGGAEVFNWTFPIGGGESAPASRDPKDAKDVKSIVAPSGGSDESLSIGFTAFQGIYADNNEYNAPTAAPDSAHDVWQFVEQVPVQFNFNKSTFIKVAPGFDTYFGGGNNGPSNVPATIDAAEAGGGSEAFTAYNATNDLAIFQAPGEVDWKAAAIPFKFYWDFDLNTEGKDRIQDVYLRPTPGATPSAASLQAQSQNRELGDNIAWVAGLQVGQVKKKGDWLVKADFRQVGLGAIDPNLNDSDWGDSFLNQQGVKLSASYGFTDFLVGSITAYDTWALKSGLFAGQNPSGLPVVAGASGTTAGLQGLAAASQTQRVDVDLQWKF